MTRVLVAYASKHGATAEIAAAIADRLKAAGHDADCLPAEAADELGEHPLWLFSSGPCGTDPDPSWAEPKSVRTAAKKLEARDHTVFGGRLPLEPTNFMERGMLNATPPEQRDLRDWDEIRAWADAIAAKLGAQG